MWRLLEKNMGDIETPDTCPLCEGAVTLQEGDHNTLVFGCECSKVGICKSDKEDLMKKLINDAKDTWMYTMEHKVSISTTRATQ